jgi:hypothetical protein
VERDDEREPQQNIGKLKCDFVKLEHIIEVCFFFSIQVNRVQVVRDADEFEVVQPNETMTINVNQ